jgi:hypothetical protein
MISLQTDGVTQVVQELAVGIISSNLTSASAMIIYLSQFIKIDFFAASKSQVEGLTSLNKWWP